ncbi:MAG TPA: class I SAM-dependent methyltransferase [Streptosporangiaceae bacterium]|jgi:SAM-dependent methyltransferase
MGHGHDRHGHDGHGHDGHGHPADGHGDSEDGHGEWNSPWHYTEEFWDERYRTADQLWSGQPNPQLVAQVSGLPPGDALEAGCGEGADAIWLAGRGWTVTGVDVSGVALERAARHAAGQRPELVSRLTWQRHDLREWTPEPDRFDLVTAAFMHLTGDELTAFHRRLARAVRPGGTLLIVAHHADDRHANVGRPHEPALFPTAQGMAAGLLDQQRDTGRWEVGVASAFTRAATDLDGQPTTVKDTVLRMVRLR